MAKCLQVLKTCQDVEAVLDYGFNWTREFSRRWARDVPFDSGITIRPEGEPSGFEYLSSGGQTGSEEPVWPKVVGATVKDGSITWTTQTMSNNSLMQMIASDAWSDSVPAGLVVNGAAYIDTPGLQQTMVILSEGVVGTTYEVDNEVFTNLGREYIARIIIKIE